MLPICSERVDRSWPACHGTKRSTGGNKRLHMTTKTNVTRWETQKVKPAINSNGARIYKSDPGQDSVANVARYQMLRYRALHRQNGITYVSTAFTVQNSSPPALRFRPISSSAESLPSKARPPQVQPLTKHDPSTRPTVEDSSPRGPETRFKGNQKNHRERAVRHHFIISPDEIFWWGMHGLHSNLVSASVAHSFRDPTREQNFVNSPRRAALPRTFSFVLARGGSCEVDAASEAGTPQLGRKVNSPRNLASTCETNQQGLR